jgi:phosphate transport system permease protein
MKKLIATESIPREKLHVVTDITRRSFRLVEFIGESSIRGIAFIALAAIVLIMAFVFRETLPLFNPPDASQESKVIYNESESYGDVPGDESTVGDLTPTAASELETAGAEGTATFKNLIGTEWQPVSGNPKYGLIPLIMGSFKVTLIALLFAAPIGILSALFAVAFAPRWVQEIFKPTVEILAGFPSVVVGFFALMIMATFMQDLFGYQFRLNAFVGGLALSLAVIPIIFTVTEDALNAVPKSFTEASLALGANKWQTVIFVVFPAATPGVMASLILGFGRAFGETMIVLMATGNATMMTLNLFEPVRTLSATIGAEMAEVVFGDTHYNVLFLIGSILFIFTFVLNAVAEFWVRQKLMKRFRGN